MEQVINPNANNSTYIKNTDLSINLLGQKITDLENTSKNSLKAKDDLIKNKDDLIKSKDIKISSLESLINSKNSSISSLEYQLAQKPKETIGWFKRVNINQQKIYAKSFVQDSYINESYDKKVSNTFQLEANSYYMVTCVAEIENHSHDCLLKIVCENNGQDLINILASRMFISDTEQSGTKYVWNPNYRFNTFGTGYGNTNCNISLSIENGKYSSQIGVKGYIILHKINEDLYNRFNLSGYKEIND